MPETITTITGLINAARAIPLDTMQHYGINPIDLIAIFIILIIVSIVFKKYEEKARNYEPGYFYSFWPDAENRYGEPVLFCPECKKGLIVPTRSRESARKVVQRHISTEHPGRNITYQIPERPEPTYHISR